MSDNNINEELLAAVIKKDFKKVKALLSAGADPNFKPNKGMLLPHQYGNRLLHYASSLGCVEIAKELLLHGAWIDPRNEHIETPLHTAAMSCSKLMIKELLKHGSDVNARNRKRNTPLNLAVKKRDKDLGVIRELLDYGADINIKNRERGLYETQYSPLDNAINYPECAKLLIKFTLINNFNNNYEEVVNSPFKPNWNISRYFDDCVCEIEQMKTNSINNNLCLYEFITAKIRNSGTHVNDDFVTDIVSGVIQTRYPIYHDIISERISACLLRSDLLDKLNEINVSAKKESGFQGEYIILDSDLKLEIAEYLSNYDILNLITAFYAHKEKPSCLKKNFTESNKRLNEVEVSDSAKCARKE